MNRIRGGGKSERMNRIRGGGRSERMNRIRGGGRRERVNRIMGGGRRGAENGKKFRQAGNRGENFFSCLQEGHKANQALLQYTLLYNYTRHSGSA